MLERLQASLFGTEAATEIETTHDGAKEGARGQAGLSRRALVQNSALFGLSAGAGLLDSGLSRAQAAGYDPKKYAGTELSILMTGDENDHRALGDLLPQLEAETGIKLKITAPNSMAVIEKTLQNLKDTRSSFELIEFIGFLTTQQVGGGYYEQLNSYLDNPAETPADFDFADFLQPALRNVGIYDIKNQVLGQGKDVYALPGMHSGSVIYFYRKDLFDAAGLKPAKTWDEFKAIAQKLNSDDVAGVSFIGANDFSLGIMDWFTRFITTGGKLMSGSPNQKNFTPHVDSPEGVGALQLLIDLLPYSPKNVTQYGFAQNVDGFASGKIAQMVFWATIAGPVYNKDNSMVADKVATAPVPAGPGQTPRAVQGGWGLGIPKNADPAKKAAAWRALTWITSKATNKFELEKYQIDVNRQSTLKDPELVKQFPFLPDALAAGQTAETIPTCLINEFYQLNDSMNVEFNKALIGFLGR